ARQACEQSSGERIVGGSFWTDTVCYLGHLARVGRFRRPVIRLRARGRLRGTLTRAGKSGERTKLIRAIQLTENFIATLVSITPWNTWDQSHAGAENFPA